MKLLTGANLQARNSLLKRSVVRILKTELVASQGNVSIDDRLVIRKLPVVDTREFLNG